MIKVLVVHMEIHSETT